MSRLPSPAVAALVLLFRRNSRAARIYSVVVHPRARGQGLGRALVTAAERAAHRAGCSAISLEVRSNSRAARALYRKLGYAETARLPRYYSDGAIGLRLRKSLKLPLNPERLRSVFRMVKERSPKSSAA